MAAPQQEPNLDIAEMVSEFDRKLDRLKILYEQYFMGIEKREPTVALKDVVRIMRDIDQLQIRNTGLRFRYRTLVQKLNTYKTYWNRILRAIENGTYQRDIARLGRNLAKKGIAMPQLGRVTSAAEVERAVSEAMRGAQEVKDDTEKMPALRNDDAPEDPITVPLPPAVRARARTPQPEPSLRAAPDGEIDEDEVTNPGRRGSARSSANGPSPGTGPIRPPAPSPSQQTSVPESEMRSLFRRFVKAKEMCGEDVSKIRYESLVKSISRQLPKLQAQHQGHDVEFQVVIRDGRAILLAKPK